MSLRSWLAGASAICIAGLLTGCSSYSGPFDGYYDTRESQPLGDGGGALICTPVELGSNVTYAYDQFSNGRPDRDVTIDRVRLLNPEGVHLARADLSTSDAPDGESATGLLEGWPAAPNGTDDPDDPDDPPVATWTRATPALGQVLEAGKENRAYLLVLRLRTEEAPKATLGGVEIEYHDSTGRAFRRSGGYAMQMLDPDFDRCF